MIETGDQQFVRVGRARSWERNPLFLSQKLTLGISSSNTLLFYFPLKKEITRQKGIVFSVEKRLFPFLYFQIR